MFAFTLLTLLSVVSFAGAYFLFSFKSRITGTGRLADECRFLSLEKSKEINRVLLYDIKDEFFFSSGGNSRSRQQFFSHHAQLISGLSKLSSDNFFSDKATREKTDSISRLESELVKDFNRFIETALLKGYKDHGVEGRMREYAHALMETPDIEIKELALMLRRHEKDYIIRKEDEYISKFNSTADEFRKLLLEKYPGKKNAVDLLGNYRLYFTRFAQLQKKMGTHAKEGEMGALNEQRARLDAIYASLKNHIVECEAAYNNTFRTWTIIFIALLVATSVALGFIYSFQLSRDTVGLNEKITLYTRSKFEKIPTRSDRIRVEEIEEIDRNISVMAHELDTYINKFRQKVDEKTAELNRKADELFLKNLETLRQKDILVRQKSLLENQKKMLADQHESLMDSLRCAHRIQHALLPPAGDFRAVFDDSFIFHQPKDIVSGDFYWMEKVSVPSPELLPELAVAGGVSYGRLASWPSANNGRNLVVFAAADCTGHGVPAAFMSIMGHNHLTKIVTEKITTAPHMILQLLNREIQRTLRAGMNGNSMFEGMEIALCVYDQESNLLSYAGANKKSYLVRNGEAIELASARDPIGSSHLPGGEPDYFCQEIQVRKGDTLYLFSDGFQDQFGGPRNKKFKSENFRDMLVSVSGAPLTDQHNIIRSVFNKWKGNNFQVDDVLVIGVRF